MPENHLKMAPEEVLASLSTDIDVGLSSAEVISRQRIHGLNKLEGEEKVLRYLITVHNKFIKI